MIINLSISKYLSFYTYFLQFYSICNLYIESILIDNFFYFQKITNYMFFFSFENFNLRDQVK